MTAQAAMFQDVPDGHDFQVPIESLSGSGVIKGNPDGRYYPDNRVNRAEMLTMLYRAMNIAPQPSSTSCFPDVETGAWYESVVCDAVGRKYVSGYPDGLFRPADSVSRVEALKMIHTVFEFEVGGDATQSNNVPVFTDIPTSSWFAAYVANAHAIGMLPISGQAGAYFGPALPLTRKEAAAYIHNAFYARSILREKARIASIPRPQVDASDTKRRSDVNAILNAVYQYAIDNRGKPPVSVPNGAPKEICAVSGKECSGLVDLSVVIREGKNYLDHIPSDATVPYTGYSIYMDSNGRIIVTALNAQGEQKISVTR